MKKRILCSLVAVIAITAMVMPAAASSYGEVVDTTGRAWEINQVNNADGSTTSTLRLSVADRLDILNQGLYPAIELEQRADSMFAMPEGIDYHIQLRAADLLRHDLLTFFPDQYAIIMYSDYDSLLRFARKQLESPAFKALRDAMAPLEELEDNGGLAEALRSTYSDQEMDELYANLETVISEYFAGTDNARLVTALRPVVFQS